MTKFGFRRAAGLAALAAKGVTHYLATPNKEKDMVRHRFQKKRFAKKVTIKRPAARSATTSTSVTAQHDVSVDFKSRNRPRTRRAKRKWRRVKSWRRRVSRVLTSQYPNNRIMHQSVFRIQTVENKTDCASYQLYGADGNRDALVNPCSDLRHVFIESLSGLGYGTGTGTAADKALEFDNQENSFTGTRTELSDPRILFSKGVMESTMRNVGTNDCIIEVYQFICRKSAPSTIVGATIQPGTASPTDLYSAGFLKSRQVESEAASSSGGHVVGGPVIGFKDVGSTPFQSRLFTKFFRIIKRTRYRLAPGTEASFVHKFPKRFSLYATQVKGRMALAGITSGFLYQIQGCPGVGSDGNAKMALPADLIMTNVRHYNIQYYPGITGTGTLNATSDIYQSV